MIDKDTLINNIFHTILEEDFYSNAEHYSDEGIKKALSKIYDDFAKEIEDLKNENESLQQKWLEEGFQKSKLIYENNELKKLQNVDDWHYPSKNDFPPLKEKVFVWDNGELYKGDCFKSINNKIFWQVYGKGAICSMQSKVDAWKPLNSIQPPKEI